MKKEGGREKGWGRERQTQRKRDRDGGKGGEEIEREAEAGRGKEEGRGRDSFPPALHTTLCPVSRTPISHHQHQESR